jgi:hypothetical protein
LRSVRSLAQGAVALLMRFFLPTTLAVSTNAGVEAFFSLPLSR